MVVDFFGESDMGCNSLQINIVNKFSKLLTFINGGGNAAHKILRIFAIEKADFDLK